MSKKAKGTNPWTKRKLNKYRAAKEEERKAERKEDKRLAARLRRESEAVNRSMEGCRG